MREVGSSALYPHKFSGLNGANLLAYMAALGALRLLGETPSRHPESPVVRLSWTQEDGAWIPTLHHSQLATPGDLVKELGRRCHQAASDDAELRRKMRTAKNSLREAQKKLNEGQKEQRNELRALRGKERKVAKERGLEKEDALRSEIAPLRQAWLKAVAEASAAPQFRLGEDINATPDEFTRYAREAAESASPTNRAWADFAAALACEACLNDSGSVEDTHFRTMSGAGHQHFLGSMSELYKRATAEDIRLALFRHWQYSDPVPYLRWDPNDRRSYALRARNPANDRIDPILTVRGANRLAIEALPLFPTIPTSRGLATTGFTRFEGRETLTWPVWTPALSVETVKCLLSVEELQLRHPERAELSARGVGQVFRAVRFTEGQYRNFSIPTEML